jgi:2-polyprenyl-3-methyl-5-hydroxy-6-metoxy-1,4-benzoquinol methylase
MKYRAVYQRETEVEDWPADGLEQAECCPVCGSTQRRELYSGLTDRVFRCAPGRWNLYQCEGCRSAYLDPRPTRETIHRAYQRYYTHAPPRRQSTEGLRVWRRFVRALANGYRNARYGGGLTPASALGPWIIPLFPRLRQVLDRELRYLPPLEQGARLLDVGFGSGAFLLLAQRIGWRVFGADLDPVAVANASEAGLDARQGGIEAFSDATDQFDVITMSHVIEHVHDPASVIKQAYKLLKPGGLLYIDTPNIDAYGHRHFKEHWRGLEIPRHLVIFNWSSMKNLLNEAGFSEVHALFRFSPYAKLAGASRAIERGVDPYVERRVRVFDVINELRFDWIPFSDGKRTEFITVNATKSFVR